jgi:hypothetical protein
MAREPSGRSAAAVMGPDPGIPTCVHYFVTLRTPHRAP